MHDTFGYLASATVCAIASSSWLFALMAGPAFMWSMIIVSPGWRSAIGAKAALWPGARNMIASFRLILPRIKRASSTWKSRAFWKGEGVVGQTALTLEDSQVASATEREPIASLKAADDDIRTSAPDFD